MRSSVVLKNLKSLTVALVKIARVLYGPSESISRPQAFKGYTRLHGSATHKGIQILQSPFVLQHWYMRCVLGALSVLYNALKGVIRHIFVRGFPRDSENLLWGHKALMTP